MDAELTAVRDFVGNHLPYDSLEPAALQSSARLRTAVLATRVSDSRQAIFRRHRTACWAGSPSRRTRHSDP